jgi:hypothetical protein
LFHCYSFDQAVFIKAEQKHKAIMITKAVLMHKETCRWAEAEQNDKAIGIVNETLERSKQYEL